MYKKAANPDDVQLSMPDPYLQEELENSEKQRKQLEAENARLRIQLESATQQAKEARERQVEAQCKCDTYKLSWQTLKQTLDKLQSEGIELPEDTETVSNPMQDADVIQGYLERIAELEHENSSLRDLKAISDDFMERASMSVTPKRSPLQFRGSTMHQIPELAEVDQDLVNEQMAAAEEEHYRWARPIILD